MKAYLYQLKLYEANEEHFIEKEFIVVGDDPDKRQAEAKRVEALYAQHVNKDIKKTVLYPPIKIKDSLITENGAKTPDWATLKNRIHHQNKNRPRGIGCIFRGPTTNNDDLLTPEDIKCMKECMKRSLDEYRENDEPFLFIGSHWEPETRQRTGSVCIFEASGIRLAAALIELHFLAPKQKLTLTEWCHAIYFI